MMTDAPAGDATVVASPMTTGAVAARAVGLTKIYGEGNTQVVAQSRSSGWWCGSDNTTVDPCDLRYKECCCTVHGIRH